MANKNVTTPSSSLTLKGTAASSVLNKKQQDLWVNAQSKSVLINLPQSCNSSFLLPDTFAAELLGFEAPWYF